MYGVESKEEKRAHIQAWGSRPRETFNPAVTMRSISTWYQVPGTVPGTSGKPSPTGKMTVGFSCTMNHANTNSHLWLFLGHKAGVMEYARTGHTSLCEKKVLT